MDPFVLGAVGLGVVFILLFLGMPIAFATGLVGFAGLLLLKGVGAAGDTVAFLSYRITANYALTVIPLFIIMGYFAFFAGLTRDLYDTARKWLGHLPGGLAIATVFGCAGFAACSGSSAAAAAVMGKATIPEMRKSGYDPKLAAGVVAASGTLASLIPPSNMIVIYGIITEQSIGTLLIAGFIPGIVSAIIYALMLYLKVRLNPKSGPVTASVPWRDRLIGLKGVWGMVVLMVIVLGGLYTGVFTPSEAGGVAAFGAFVMAVAMRRLTWANLKESLLETGKTTAMIFAVLIGVLVLLRFFTLSGFTEAIVNYALGLQVPPLLVLIGIIAVYAILGTFMTALGTMMITLPLVLPVIIGLGYNPIWFGIIVIKMVEIALITPPVGVNVYVVKGVAPDIPLEDIFKGTFPFLAMDFLTVALFIAVPQIIMWLPNTMMAN